MERLPRQQQTKEFRGQSVRVVLEQKLTIPEAARCLVISEKRPVNSRRRETAIDDVHY